MACRMSMENKQEQAQNNPQDIRKQIRTLQRKLNQLEQSKTSPQQVEQEAQQSGMCSMCDSMMSNMGPNPSKEQLEQGLEQRIKGLEQRGLVGACAHSLIECSAHLARAEPWPGSAPAHFPSWCLPVVAQAEGRAVMGPWEAPAT